MSSCFVSGLLSRLNVCPECVRTLELRLNFNGGKKTFSIVFVQSSLRLDVQLVYDMLCVYWERWLMMMSSNSAADGTLQRHCRRWDVNSATWSNSSRSTVRCQPSSFNERRSKMPRRTRRYSVWWATQPRHSRTHIRTCKPISCTSACCEMIYTFL